MKDRSNVARLAAWSAAVVVLVLVDVPSAEAGAWVQPPGEGYLKVSGEVFSSQKTYSVEGELMDAMPAYSHVGARTYGEVGVAPRVSVGWSLPFLSATNALDDGTTFRHSGWGDLDIRADVQIVRGPCALAAEFEGRIPLYGDTVQPGDQATASMQGSGESQFEPILGDGSREFSPGLAFGCGVPLPGWVSVSAGPNFRFDGFGDGLRWSAGGGAYAIPDRLAVKVGVSGLERFTSRDPRPTKRYVKASGGLLVELSDRFSLEGTAGYTLDGAFLARGWSGLLGLSYQGRLFPNPYGSHRR